VDLKKKFTIENNNKKLNYCTFNEENGRNQTKDVSKRHNYVNSSTSSESENRQFFYYFNSLLTLFERITSCCFCLCTVLSTQKKKTKKRRRRRSDFDKSFEVLEELESIEFDEFDCSRKHLEITNCQEK
jgi:hypothetical protein